MATLLCDARTAAGSPCKNRSAGETAGGRNYCRLASHKRQMEATASVVEEEPEVVEEPVLDELPTLEEIEEVVEEVVEPEPEPEPEPEWVETMTKNEIAAAFPCPACGHAENHRFTATRPSSKPGTPVMCRKCLHRWTL